MSSGLPGGTAAASLYWYAPPCALAGASSVLPWSHLRVASITSSDCGGGQPGTTGRRWPCSMSSSMLGKRSWTARIGARSPAAAAWCPLWDAPARGARTRARPGSAQRATAPADRRARVAAEQQREQQHRCTGSDRRPPARMQKPWSADARDGLGRLRAGPRPPFNPQGGASEAAPVVGPVALRH